MCSLTSGAAGSSRHVAGSPSAVLVQCLMEVQIKWFLGHELQFLPLVVRGLPVPVK